MMKMNQKNILIYHTFYILLSFKETMLLEKILQEIEKYNSQANGVVLKLYFVFIVNFQTR